MTAATIDCRTASGKTLDELSKLIALRAQRMGELTSDAVIATAIDCLKSLRTETRDARDSDGKYPPRQIAACGDLIPSFAHEGGHSFPCVRRGHNGPRLREQTVYFAEDRIDMKAAKVFKVTPIHERDTPYYLVAYSSQQVLQFEGRRIRNRIKRYGGLAKTALGIAMAKVSTNPSGVNSPERVKALASKLSTVTVSGSGFASGSFSLEYKDLLDYAIPALKNGAASVELALQRAANKVAGLITHTLHKAGDFEHDVETPFPDVRRQR